MNHDLSPKTVYADTGEPSAEERALLVCRMTDAERRAFGERLEGVVRRLRAMTPDDMERFLDGLECTDG